MLKDKLAAYAEAGASHIVLYPRSPDEDYGPDSEASKLWHWALLRRG